MGAGLNIYYRFKSMRSLPGWCHCEVIIKLDTSLYQLEEAAVMEQENEDLLPQRGRSSGRRRSFRKFLVFINSEGVTEEEDEIHPTFISLKVDLRRKHQYVKEDFMSPRRRLHL